MPQGLTAPHSLRACANVQCEDKGMLGNPASVQRAENGGLDPSWLGFAFLGRPDFPSRGS